MENFNLNMPSVSDVEKLRRERDQFKKEMEKYRSKCEKLEKRCEQLEMEKKNSVPVFQVKICSEIGLFSQILALNRQKLYFMIKKLYI